jgi:hypothetical protein
MKTIYQIAVMTNLTWNAVAIYAQDFEPAAYNGKIKLYDENQVQLICELMKVEFLTFESKMNVK